MTRARALAAAILMTEMVLVAGLAAGDPAEFHAYIMPESSAISVGETAEVRFEVDETALQFNAYQVTIEYDPAIVTLLEVEEGALMLGACGITFFVTAETDSTITVTHVILCGQNPASIDGPGVLSVYTFGGLAAGVTPVEIVSHPDSTFANAGTPLNPDHPTFPRQVILHHGSIGVTQQNAVMDGSPTRRQVLEQNVPNPFNPMTDVRFEVTGSGPVRFDVFDLQGRRVWHRDWRMLPAGPHRLRWDATDLDGRPLPSGVYLYRLDTPAGSVTKKMTLVR